MIRWLLRENAMIAHAFDDPASRALCGRARGNPESYTPALSKDERCEDCEAQLSPEERST